MIKFSIETISRKNQRLSNQDCIFYNTTLNEKATLLLVSDGMGGVKQGYQSSHIIVETFSNAFKSLDINSLDNDTKIKEFLTDTTHIANIKILENCKDGGATLSVVLIINNIIHLLNVGDSPIFLINKKDSSIKLISKQQTVADDYVENGKIAFRSDDYWKIRHILTSALGAIKDYEYFYNKTNLNIGDILFLCSDGFVSKTDTQTLKTMMLNNQSLLDIALYGVSQFQEKDNQSCIKFIRNI